MADDATNNEKQDTDTETETVDAPKDKTYTEAEVQAMITGRLSAHDKALKKQFAEETKKQSERAKLEESERLKADMADLEKERDEALKAAKEARYRADFAGQVSNVNAALRLLDEEKHVKDGAVDVKAFLKEHDYLTPARQATAPGGGGTQPGNTADPLSSLAAAQAADRAAGR